MDIPTSFIRIVVLFDEACKYDNCAKFWGYGGASTEPLCVNFCNFMQHHMFVNYLIYYYRFHTTLFFSWYDNVLILKPPVSCHGGRKYFEVHPSQVFIAWIVLFISEMSWMLVIPTWRLKKDTNLYINLFLFITWISESRCWVQSLNTTCLKTLCQLCT
jgi:hypothetical protein